MKKYASIALRKGKTDKIDSARIANFGLDNWLCMEPYKPDEEIYGELKILGRQYSHYIKIQIQNKLVLTNILDRTMPRIKKMLHHDSNATEKDKLADFVERYCHYDNITRMTERKFVESYNKCAKKKGYHQSESKAKKIYALAKDGILHFHPICIHENARIGIHRSFEESLQNASCNFITYGEISKGSKKI